MAPLAAEPAAAEPRRGGGLSPAANRSLGISLQIANAGALATLALGALGLLLPGKAARRVSISPVGRTGISEIRATYGGLFAMLAAVVLVAQDRAMFGMVGAAWAGAAAGRLFSIWRDANRERKNLGAFVLELAIGLALLAPVIELWWRQLMRSFR